MSVRLALGIEYDGAAFNGWQVQQPGVPTVQGAVERALSKVADESVTVHCAGRTDTGVHACEQVVHFETNVQRDLRSWVFGANANLPKQVSVLWAHPVAADFHARFAATRRRYRYVIFNRDVRPTFLAWRTAWEYRPLDEALMLEAGQHLVGEHDFSSYRAVACQAKSPVRTVYHLDVNRRGQLIDIDIEANGFLHHMVRNVAGVLMSIGAGKYPPEWAAQVLAHRDRTLGGVTAPPHGLYFVRATYPEHFGLPQVSPETPVW